MYTSGGYYNKDEIEISVVNKKVQVVFNANKNDNSSNDTKRRLWHYNAQTGAVSEIAISLPATQTSQINSSTSSNSSTSDTTLNLVTTPVTISVPELAKLTIDSSSIAPDGYEFTVKSNRNSGGPFGDLFYSNRYKQNARLLKNGRSVRLPNLEQQYYYRNNIKMIGWVITE